MPPAGPTGAGRGRGGRADPGGRRGQPLDARGGRGQGPAPLLSLPRPLPELHRDPPGQEPPHRRSLRQRRAARHLDELPDPRADRAVPARARATTAIAARLYLSRGRSVGLRMVPMPRDLRFAWEEMPQQVLDVQAAEGPREPARGPDRLGRSRRRRQRLHRQPAACSACIRSAIGSRCPTCCATARSPACSPSGRN